MWSRGLITVLRLRGFTLRLHLALALPLGLAALGGFWAGAATAFFVLLISHELGHAAIARRLGARIVGFDLSLFVGDCRFEGDVSPLGRVAISWGGVAAQLALFTLSTLALGLLGFSAVPFVDGLAWVLVLLNPVVAFVNLYPHHAFDGHWAWQLLPMLRARRQLERLEGRVPQPEELDTADLVETVAPEEARPTLTVPWLIDATGQQRRLDIRPRR